MTTVIFWDCSMRFLSFGLFRELAATRASFVPDTIFDFCYNFREIFTNFHSLSVYHIAENAYFPGLKPQKVSNILASYPRKWPHSGDWYVAMISQRSCNKTVTKQEYFHKFFTMFSNHFNDHFPCTIPWKVFTFHR